MAPPTMKTCLSAPAEAPPYSQHINDLAFQDNCLLEPSHLTLRKRACSEHHTDKQREATPPIKRRKARHPIESPSAYQDNLSRISLTKPALRELDRRNTQAVVGESRTSQKQSSIASERGSAVSCSDDPRILKACRTLSRHGGPDLSDLRKFSEPNRITKHTINASCSSTQSQHQDSFYASTISTMDSKKTNRPGPYNRCFETHLETHNIHRDGYKYFDGSRPTKPDNWEDLQRALIQPRPSLAPSQFTDHDFTDFKSRDDWAKLEKQVSERVLPVIEGTIDDSCRSGGLRFTNLDPLTDGSIKPGNPDTYYGARPAQLNEQVRTKLGGYIVPSTQKDLPIAPNFFLAAKGPNGSLQVAQRQACYDGALGARGMARLEEYGQGEPRYGTAYTISSTYHGGTLKMYTSHLAPAQPSELEGRPEYHTTQINTWGMTGNADTFRQGARAYRNGRDWAKKQRDDLIKQVNERAAFLEVDNDAEESPAPNSATAASGRAAYTKNQKS